MEAQVFGEISFAKSNYRLRPAEVSIDHQKILVIDGQFRLDVAPGSWTISVQAPHYKTYQEKYEFLPGENSVELIMEPIYTLDELDHFARLVHAEAAGEPYSGQVAVAASVLHRVESPQYPDTIKGVIYQVVDGRYYQYSPVLDNRINTPANQRAFQAVYDALAGYDPSKGATGFYNPQKTSNRWVRSRPVTATIAKHIFFK